MRRTTALAAACAALALAGCAPTVNLPAAEGAADPGCASVIVSLPRDIGTGSLAAPLERRTVSSQATAAYGQPTAVTLRCGMPEPAPSTSRCVTTGDVDWLEVSQEGAVWTFVAYGRAPATEVVVDTVAVSAVTALEALSAAVARTERTGACA